jgi:hypothetical protein
MVLIYTMNALLEYGMLQDFVTTKEGWDQIDELWMIGTDYIKDEQGDWIKARDSVGEKCTGIAIDLKTWEVVNGRKGGDRSFAYNYLVDKILKESCELLSVGKIEERVVKVYIIDVTGSDWNHPLALIQDWQNLDIKKLVEIEEKIIELEIGLPLVGLFLAKNPTLKNLMVED